MTFPNTRSTALAVVMIGLATPALAQDNMCGGTGTGGIWIGGDEAGSDIASVENYQEQMALVLGGNEYVALFSLSEPTDVRVEAEGRGAGDPIIDLLDSSGGVILSDDDSGGNAAARAERFLDPGTYCMSLRSYDGGPKTAFVRVGRVEHDSLTDGIENVSGTNDPNGSCSEASPINGLGATVTSSAFDTPFWNFTLDAPTAITITAENESADPVVTLFGPDEEYIDENDDFDGLNSRLDMADPLAPGTYCIGVAALDDDRAPITISLTEYDPQAALLGLYANGEAAPPLDGSIPVTDLGVLETRLRQDVQSSTDASWFSIQIEEPGLILAEAIGVGNNDPWLVIYDDLGREVGQNDDYGTGFDSLLAAKVERGTYVVGVRQLDSRGVVRLVLERFVRAQ